VCAAKEISRTVKCEGCPQQQPRGGEAVSMQQPQGLWARVWPWANSSAKPWAKGPKAVSKECQRH